MRRHLARPLGLASVSLGPTGTRGGRRMKKDMASTERTGNRNFKGGMAARKAGSKHGRYGTKSRAAIKKRK